LIIIGKITGCFGVKGYLKVHPVTHSVERFNSCTTLYVGQPDAEPVAAEVEDVIHRPPHVLIRLAGYPDRTAAEKLVGTFLFVKDADALPPPGGSWFVHDIIGCDVRTAGGEIVGVVTDVYRMPAQDVWEFRTSRGTVLFPAVKEFITDVDISRKLIIISPPAGLLSEDM